MTATFQGIYNPQTNEYLGTQHTADDIETMDTDGILIGVIHGEGGQELTFQCFGEGLCSMFPTSWEQYWDELSDAEKTESLLPRSGDDFHVSPDFFEGCSYKQSYSKNN